MLSGVYFLYLKSDFYRRHANHRVVTEVKVVISILIWVHDYCDLYDLRIGDRITEISYTLKINGVKNRF